MTQPETNPKPKSTRKTKPVDVPSAPTTPTHRLLYLAGTQAEIEATLNSLARYGWTIVSADVSLSSGLFHLLGLATKPGAVS